MKINNTIFKTKIYERYIKLSVFEISLMALLLALLTVIKYLTFIIFKGPLNFSVEILFWIVIGILFGPIKGPIFSILCDTIFTLFTSGIVYWMIEYAVVAPLISLLSWCIFNIYKENDKKTIFIALFIQTALLISSIIIFTFQALNEFKYENVKKVIPAVAYSLIIFLNSSIILFTTFCLTQFKRKKEWKYIKWLYIFSLIVLIIIIFRWIWGPYAFIAYTKRFFPKNIDFGKQYWLTLCGIVTKSCLSIPIATSILIPLIYVVDLQRQKNLSANKY